MVEQGQEVSVVVLVADGSEEMEAVITIDILRRAQIKVTVAKVDGDGSNLQCKMSRGVVIVADTHLKEVYGLQMPSMVVVPGGLEGAVGL